MKKSLSILLAFLLAFSATSVFADSNNIAQKAKVSHGMREATSEEYLSVVKQLNLKSENVEKILIVEQDEKNELIEKKSIIEPYSLLVKYSIEFTTKGTGSNPLRTYHLAPNGYFEYTQGFEVDRTLSANIGLSVSEVSAGLGYSRSSTSSLTETVGYVNDTGQRVEARIHPLIEFTHFTARNRITNKLYGTATLGVPMGLAVVVIK